MAILSLAALSCSYEFRIDASFREGRLLFTAGRGGWFAADPCVESLEIIARDAAPGARTLYRPVWRIEQAGGVEPVCAPLPIVFGQVPAGLRQSIAPEALRPGADYEIIAGSHKGDGFGSFRISAANPNAVETPN